MPKHPIYIYRTDGRVETQHISLDHMTDALKRGVGGYAVEIPPPPASICSALDCDGERVEMPQNASYYVNEDGLKPIHSYRYLWGMCFAFRRCLMGGGTMPKYSVDVQTWGYLSVSVEAKDEQEAWEKVFLENEYDYDENRDHDWTNDWDGAWQQLQQETIQGVCKDTGEMMDPSNLSKRLREAINE